jgi:hypothetical protein
MVLVPGGEFWMGAAESERVSPDESPRFRTALAPFCLDRTEVTAGAYASCVRDGKCTAPRSDRRLCTGARADRVDHPINCVTHPQAEAYCRSFGARLPTELEWEYAARGGSQQLRYPWGDAPLDGRTCWKHDGTCKVGSFAPGAFGLFDMSGNVWEWTETWYGPYPFPPETGFAKVYRGGSFSRRFPKWMHLGLRNREGPNDLGSHLGFRCALTLAGTKCPFGASPEGRCVHGVLGRDCPQGASWNGVRCAAPGEPRCRSGRVEKPGFGCVFEIPPEPEARDLDAEMAQVLRTRAPGDDADCRANQPARPHAFRYSGGTHDARTRVVGRHRCKNRDVGVGWNSACCP